MRVFDVPQEYQAQIQPYTSRFLQFQWSTVVMVSDTSQRPILPSSRPIEFLLVSARADNGFTVSLWNESVGLDLNAGIALQPGDTFTFGIDNTAYDVAQAFASVQGARNPLPRQAMDSGMWLVRARSAAGTVRVDVCVGIGPAQ